MPPKFNDIILLCEKLDSEVNELDYSDISVDTKRRNSVSYLPINDETSWIYDKIYDLSVSANQEMGWNFNVDGINQFMAEDKSIILITHYQRLLDYINPTYVHVMQNGKIIKTGSAELAKELESKGYEWLK